MKATIKTFGLLLCMIIFVQCENERWEENFNDSTQNPTSTRGNGPGGPGGGQNGNGGGENGGAEGLYGDLIICLRYPNGIPQYEEIDGEHGLEFYSVPIMFDEVTMEPAMIDNTYQTFELNIEGEAVLEDGFFSKEVEFGRLNLIRSPQSVLDNALAEAISNLTQPGITDITIDASGRLIAIIGMEDWLMNYDDDLTNDESDDKTIDSPRENMALYQELMSNGLTDQLSFLTDYGFTEQDIPALSYSAVAAGSDKTGTMFLDELAYMNYWLLKWDSPTIKELPDSPDCKDRRYYDYSDFSYNRNSVYQDKYVRITVLGNDGSWKHTFEPLTNVVPWTKRSSLIDYENGNNVNITGFSYAADDAVQVLEYIHESDLIQYSPYFTSSGFNPPN